MPDSKSVKSGVLLFLVVALIWRIKTSFNKLVFSDEVTIYRTEDVVSMPFPSVTLCLVPNETERARFWPESFNDVKSASSSFSQVILSARADLRNSGGQLMRMNFAEPNEFLYRINDQNFQVWSRPFWLGHREISFCHTMTLPINLEVGPLNLVELKINSTGLTGLYISIHNQNAFLPSNGVKFGTDLAFIGLNRPKTKTLTQQVFNIKINNKTRLPTKKYPCNKKSSFVHGGLRKCWMDYVQTEIACLPPGNIWELAAAAAGSQSRNCSGESDLANYQNVLSTLTAMTQEQVIKQLNCEMPCTHQEYTLSREADRFRSREQADVGADISLVGFMIKDGVVDITHETQMYDENDFISDFGGMMGLLLGASVLSLYELLAEVLKKCYTRLFNRDAYP